MRTLVLTLILLCAVTVYAQQPLPDPLMGARPGAFSARSLALGHTSLIEQAGPAALLCNPASLTVQEGQLLLTTSGDVVRIDEKRKYPYYDAFNGVLGWNNYAVNDHLYSKLDGGLSYRIPMKTIESLVLSVGSYSTYRFDYTYHEEVRDRYAAGGLLDTRLGENRLDVTGDMRSLSAGAAAKLKNLSLGIGASFLTGSWDYLNNTYYANPDSQNVTYANHPNEMFSRNHINAAHYSVNGTPMEALIGATYILNERITFGGRALMPGGDYKFKRAAHTEYDTLFSASTADVKVKYPKQYALGVTYRPQSEFRPQLFAEGEIRTFSDTDPTYNDVWEFRGGAEQQVTPGVPVRLGFVYTTSPTSKDNATTMFTAGIGFHVNRLYGDVALEMGKMNTMSQDLFSQKLFGGVDRKDMDRVETSVLRGMVTFKYEL